MDIGADAVQILDDVIDLGAWRRDEDFEYHPIGSKPKRNYICPDNVAHPYLIAGHTYLFKIAQGWQSGQMWSEVLAYQVGMKAGLNVPPCFIAFDPSTDEWGVLVEFFVEYPGEQKPDRLSTARISCKDGASPLVRTGRITCRQMPKFVRNLAFLTPRNGGRGSSPSTHIGNTDRHT